MIPTDLPFVHARDGETDGVGYTYVKGNIAAESSPRLRRNNFSCASPASLTSLGNLTMTVPNLPSDEYSVTSKEKGWRDPTVTRADIS